MCDRFSSAYILQIQTGMKSQSNIASRTTCGNCENMRNGLFEKTAEPTAACTFKKRFARDGLGKT